MPLLELPHSPHCLVCSRSNPHGLRLSLQVDPDTREVRTTFTPSEHHVGFEGVLHGGLLATVLDEAMVWAAIWTSRRACLAGELTTRFRSPGRVGVALTCVARVTSARARLIETSGTLVDPAGNLIASGTAKYVPLAAEATADFLRVLVPEPTTEAARARLVDGVR